LQCNEENRIIDTGDWQRARLHPIDAIRWPPDSRLKITGRCNKPKIIINEIYGGPLPNRAHFGAMYW